MLFATPSVRKPLAAVAATANNVAATDAPGAIYERNSGFRDNPSVTY